MDRNGRSLGVDRGKTCSCVHSEWKICLWSRRSFPGSVGRLPALSDLSKGVSLVNYSFFPLHYAHCRLSINLSFIDAVRENPRHVFFYEAFSTCVRDVCKTYNTTNGITQVFCRIWRWRDHSSLRSMYYNGIPVTTFRRSKLRLEKYVRSTFRQKLKILFVQQDLNRIFS